MSSTEQQVVPAHCFVVAVSALINKAQPTNQSFINTNKLKFKELVNFETAQFMHKVNNNMLPDCI